MTDQLLEKTERAFSAQSVERGRPFILFPSAPKRDENQIKQFRRLIENGQAVGILKAVADCQLPQKILRMPPDSWAVEVITEIDLASNPGLGQWTTGQSFGKVLSATTPGGISYVGFPEITRGLNDQGKPIKTFRFSGWFPIDNPDSINLIAENAKGIIANPLTLLARELTTTEFEFK